MGSSRSAATGIALGALVLAAACGAHDEHPTARATVHAHLGGDVAAMVGASPIPVSLVAQVAAAQAVEPSVALDRLIADAVAAEGARASGADRAPSVAWELEAIAGRATAARIRDEGLAAGPPTDAEVAERTEAHWRDFAMPEQVRVVHAVVMRPKDESQYPAARALAEKLATVESGAKDADDFQSRAKVFPHGSLDLRVEAPLPAFIANGRYSEGPPAILDVAFAKGAFALKKPGDTSGPVESSFGWHVIRLIERLPPKSVPLEERRAAFTDEIYTRRAHAALEALIGLLRGRGRVEVLPDSATAMAAVVSPPGQ